MLTLWAIKNEKARKFRGLFVSVKVLNYLDANFTLIAGVWLSLAIISCSRSSVL